MSTDFDIIKEAMTILYGKENVIAYRANDESENSCISVNIYYNDTFSVEFYFNSETEEYLYSEHTGYGAY